MRCIKWYSFLAILFFGCSFPAKAEQGVSTSGNDKLSVYSHLVATAIYHWNFASDISNDDILNLLDKSGLQEDASKEAIVFRHLLATSTTNDVGSAKIPVFVKSPLLKEHWQHLKAQSPKLYAAAKAYYIFSKNAVNFEDSSMRIKYSVPELLDLKTELLSLGDEEATAIASIWLAMELGVASPIQAISEIEYALPYLPEKTSHKRLESYFTKYAAHEWLRVAYIELSVPSRAYHHSLELLNSPDKAIKAWAYFFAIDALILQNKFQDAFRLSDKALEFVVDVNSHHKKFLIKVQHLRVLVFSGVETNQQEILKIQSEIEALNQKEFITRAELLVTYYYALKHALTGDENAFGLAVKNYKLALQKAQDNSAFESQIALVVELELSRLYEVFGDNNLAYHHLKNYNAILVKKNSEQFKISDVPFANSILKDIELARFRREELNELRAERLGLSEDNEQKTNTIYLLIVVIAAILFIWRRLAGNQKAKSNSAR
ncbi:MAG: GGDEF domain-containing protein [Pseudomonadota bacterium]|nr:GGDEF domain-containing protein [Pseudomonadota bacterium]